MRDKDLALRLLDWHSGQGDPIYAVGSSLLANRPENLREEHWDGALENLSRDLRFHSSTSSKLSRTYKSKICRELKKLIKDLEARKLESQQESSNTEDTYECISCGGNPSLCHHPMEDVVKNGELLIPKK